jgi:DNA ligase-1
LEVHELPTSFSKLAELCKALELTTKRLEKIVLISNFLHGLESDEIAPSVLLIVGQIFPEFDPRTLEVGWSTMKRVLERGKQTTLLRDRLSIRRVHSTLSEIAVSRGAQSRKIKERLLVRLISDAVGEEVEILVRIIFGEMRIGVNEGVMLDSLAEASGAPLSLVRRALMLTGDLGEVALIALMQGEKGLEGIKPELFVPLKPMLAETVGDAEEAIKEHGGRTVFEYKFDGARVQIHRLGDEVRIYSRRLSDVTESVPDVVNLVKRFLPRVGIIVEGEITAVGSGGKPLPFQDLMRRFTRVNDVQQASEQIPLSLHLFDVLYLDGTLLIDEPYETRWIILNKITPKELLAERTVTNSPAEAKAFLKSAMKAGHEGLMAKRLDSHYNPGARGKDWLKLKPAETMDLVIVAADWGSGRRRGWLSNYHLAARDGDEWVVVGKTFKGLTDDEFRWMTKRLQVIKVSESEYTVSVRPDVVVEVAFNEVQRSPHYKSGFALRFARILRIREDKGPSEAETLSQIRALYKRQFRVKDQF